MDKIGYEMDKKKNILLDMDGVLSNFLLGALNVLNKRLDKNFTEEEYVSDNGGWDIYDFYGVSRAYFWDAIESEPDFWLNLEPLPWAKELYEWLCELGDVTIVTSPSLDPDCARQKLEWLNKYLGITSGQVFIGGRKYLMAGQGFLIDDSVDQIRKFEESGGECVLVPGNWNSVNLNFNIIHRYIKNTMKRSRIARCLNKN